MNRITGGVHQTGGQFYDLYPAYGRLVLYWLSGQMLMKDSAKQQVGAPSGHKAPADEGTALWVKTQGRSAHSQGGSARRLPKNA